MSVKSLRPVVHVSVEVHARLSPQGFAKVINPADDVYQCPICHKVSPFTSKAPANAVMTTVGRDACVFYVHSRCAPSALIGQDLDVDTTLWIRPYWCQPQIVLNCWSSETGNARDFSIAAHQSWGFALLKGWKQSFPHLEQLHAHLSTTHPDGNTPSNELGDGYSAWLTVTQHSWAPTDGPASYLVNCPVRADPLTDGDGPPWYLHCLAEGTLGVVVLPGTAPTPADITAALDAAMKGRRALAATARLTADAEIAAHAATTAANPPPEAITKPRHDSHSLIEWRPNGNTYRTERPA